MTLIVEYRSTANRQNKTSRNKSGKNILDIFMFRFENVGANLMIVKYEI